MFVLKMEQKKEKRKKFNSFAKDVTSSHYNYTNYLMEHLFSISLLKLHFLRVLWVMGSTAYMCVRHGK